MNLAIYGGTFDPIHNGHMAVAAAVSKAFQPDRILLIPNDLPPHRSAEALSSYHHRFAMVALAAEGNAKLIPSLLESPETMRSLGRKRSYSIDTVLRLRGVLQPDDRLLFVLGADAFLEIAKWRQPVELLRACEVLAVSRPGFVLEQAIEALPEEILATGKPSIRRRRWEDGTVARIAIGGAVLHLLEGVASSVSATKVRESAQRGGSLTNLVPKAVDEYIRKTGLYRAEQNMKMQDVEW